MEIEIHYIKISFFIKSHKITGNVQVSKLELEGKDSSAERHRFHFGDEKRTYSWQRNSTKTKMFPLYDYKLLPGFIRKYSKCLSSPPRERDMLYHSSWKKKNFQIFLHAALPKLIIVVEPHPKVPTGSDQPIPYNNS